MSDEVCSIDGACPFAFSDKSEQIQGYGCLPSPYEIIQMRTRHGKTWACHSNTDKPCAGALSHMKESGIECSVIELVSVNDHWEKYVGGSDE